MTEASARKVWAALLESFIDLTATRTPLYSPFNTSGERDETTWWVMHETAGPLQNSLIARTMGPNQATEDANLPILNNYLPSVSVPQKGYLRHKRGLQTRFIRKKIETICARINNLVSVCERLSFSEAFFVSSISTIFAEVKWVVCLRGCSEMRKSLNKYDISVNASWRPSVINIYHVIRSCRGRLVG